MKCNEAVEEEPYTINEEVLKLPCHIDNNNKPIDDLNAGLNISLTGEMEKNSQTLGRNAIYTKTSKINKLPSYLCI